MRHNENDDRTLLNLDIEIVESSFENSLFNFPNSPRVGSLTSGILRFDLLKIIMTSNVGIVEIAAQIKATSTCNQIKIMAFDRHVFCLLLLYGS